MSVNSTIRQKIGVCAMCTDGNKKPLIKDLCQQHYWESVRMKSAMKSSRKNEEMEPGLPELIEEADVIFSRYVRLSAANESGIIECYICDKPVRWQDADCMHYNHREDYFLRWDLRNCKAGCQTCNRHKRGNLIKFGKRLNKENPGITDIINEEARLVYKVTRDEVRMIIFEYSQKVKALIKMVNNTS